MTVYACYISQDDYCNIGVYIDNYWIRFIHSKLVSCFRSRWLCHKRLWYSETQFNNQPTYSNQNSNPTMLHIIYFTLNISFCVLFLMFCKRLPAYLRLLWKLTPHAEIVITHDQCGFWHNPAIFRQYILQSSIQSDSISAVYKGLTIQLCNDLTKHSLCMKLARRIKIWLNGTDGWRKLHNKELPNWSSSPNNLQVIRSWEDKMRRPVTHLTRIKILYNILVRKPKGIKPLGIVRCRKERKQGVRVWIEFIWFMIWSIWKQ